LGQRANKPGLYHETLLSGKLSAEKKGVMGSGTRKRRGVATTKPGRKFRSRMVAEGGEDKKTNRCKYD